MLPLIWQHQSLGFSPFFFVLGIVEYFAITIADTPTLFFNTSKQFKELIHLWIGYNQLLPHTKDAKELKFEIGGKSFINLRFLRKHRRSNLNGGW